RYRIVDGDAAGVGDRPWRYLAVWDIDDGRLDDTIRSTRQMHARAASGGVDPADTLYRSNPGIASYARSWWVPRTHVEGPHSPAPDDLVLAVFRGSGTQGGALPAHVPDRVLTELRQSVVEATDHVLATDQLEEPLFS